MGDAANDGTYFSDTVPSPRPLRESRFVPRLEGRGPRIEGWRAALTRLPRSKRDVVVGPFVADFFESPALSVES